MNADAGEPFLNTSIEAGSYLSSVGSESSVIELTGQRNGASVVRQRDGASCCWVSNGKRGFKAISSGTFKHQRAGGVDKDLACYGAACCG